MRLRNACLFYFGIVSLSGTLSGCVEDRSGPASGLHWRIPTETPLKLTPGQSTDLVVQAVDSNGFPVDSVQVMFLLPDDKRLEFPEQVNATSPTLRTSFDATGSGLAGVARIKVAARKDADYGTAEVTASLVMWEAPADGGSLDTPPPELVAHFPITIGPDISQVSLVPWTAEKLQLPLATRDLKLYVQAKDTQGRPVNGIEVSADVVKGEDAPVGILMENGFAYRSIVTTKRTQVGALSVDGIAEWTVRTKDVQPPVSAEVRFALTRPSGTTAPGQLGQFQIDILP